MSGAEALSGYLIFELRDGRKIAGVLESVDYKGNCVLKDVIVELPEKHVSPVNEFLQYKFDGCKEFTSRAKHLFLEPDDAALLALERRCYCANGLILPRGEIEKVRRVLKPDN